MQKYKLLIDSAEFPKGTLAQLDEREKFYNIYFEERIITFLRPTQIENRPEIWEEIVEQAEVQNAYLPFDPNHHENYFTVNKDGSVNPQNNTFIEHGEKHALQGAFRTKRGARMEALRRESMVKRWKPKRGEIYFSYMFSTGEVANEIWCNCHIDMVNYFIGNTHRTKEEAEEWGRKYGEAWRVLL